MTTLAVGLLFRIPVLVIDVVNGVPQSEDEKRQEEFTKGKSNSSGGSLQGRVHISKNVNLRCSNQASF